MQSKSSTGIDIASLVPVFTALRMDTVSRLVLTDAGELAARHTPFFPPTEPVLIARIHSQQVAAEVKSILMTVYPDEHLVKLAHGAGTADEKVEEIKLSEIDHSDLIGSSTALYVPPLEPDTSMESFQEVVARLRAPDGCPWDREQTHLTLRTSLLEETYETIEAMDKEDSVALQEELGDLVLQIVLNAQIAYEAGEFRLSDVLQGINQKIVRRHPHVFGEVKVGNVDGVLRNWEKLKEAERKANGQTDKKGILDGIPLALPALSQAQKYQDRAAHVGFDWKEVDPVWDKVAEEIQEVKNAKTAQEIEEELGDLLFAVVNLVRWYKVDAESALRGTNLKFKRRFGYIEKKAAQEGHQLTDMTLPEMDVWWEEAKKEDKTEG
ncbi:MAG TPA: nucleoside triphosphate pyrophosphohydrolase [Longilinea sp.]|nr:nucleoside triphosphate pyrophosphohydrolase [Longilinea sp.]